MHGKFAISWQVEVTCITCPAGSSGKISLQQTQSAKQTLVDSGTTRSNSLKYIFKNQSIPLTATCVGPAVACRQAAAAGLGWCPQWWNQHSLEGQT